MDLASGGGADLIARELRSGSRDGTDTTIQVARRTYATEPADLWQAMTDPARIPRWFLPISGDLQVGGRYQLEGHAGGTIERCDEPSVLAITWEYGDEVSWVEVTLTPTDDGTQLQLVHEGAAPEDMWQQFGPGATGVGWDLLLLGLGVHVDSGGQAIDPAEGAAFATTPAGTAYVQQSAAAWAQAAVADGADADWANETAANTVQFYTSVPED